PWLSRKVPRGQRCGWETCTIRPRWRSASNRLRSDQSYDPFCDTPPCAHPGRGSPEGQLRRCMQGAVGHLSGWDVHARVGQMALASRRAAISWAVKPNSDSTSPVCCPRSGGGATRRVGVRPRDTGCPTTFKVPRASPVSICCTMPRWATCGSANTRSMELMAPVGTPAALRRTIQSALARWARSASMAVKGIAVLKARPTGGEPRIGHDGGRLERLAKALPHLPTGRGDVDIAVTGPEHAGGHAGWMVVAVLSRNLAGIEPARGMEIEHADLRLQQRGGALLALADG